MAIAMHCNLRPPDVALVVLGFNYEVHAWCIKYVSDFSAVAASGDSRQSCWRFKRFYQPVCGGGGSINPVVVVVNARPRRPYVTFSTRPSWAQLRASPADKPQSEQIWCSQVMGGRPRDLRQFGKGGTPSRTSHATRRTALAVALSGIRAMWPNSERRRRRTIDWILCRPDLV